MNNDDERDSVEEESQRHMTSREQVSELLAERMRDAGVEFVGCHFLRTVPDRFVSPEAEREEWHSLRAALFGHLWPLATENVKFYRGDLYRDVQWLMNCVDREVTFYYGFRDTGTSIGTDSELVAYIAPDALYRVDVMRGPYDSWYVGIGKVNR